MRTLNNFWKHSLFAFLFLVGATFSSGANAWFFFLVPLPTGWPPALKGLTERLAESKQTKALAFVGEDKTFGSKYYVWGHYVGELPQKEANKIALKNCQAQLAKAKLDMVGDAPRWDFGNEKCSLYAFSNLPESGEMPDSKEPTATPEATDSSVQFIVRPKDEFDTSSSPSIYKKPTPTLNSSPQISPPTSSGDGAKRLIELKFLLDQGLITKSDYDSKKTQILKGM